MNPFELIRSIRAKIAAVNYFEMKQAQRDRAHYRKLWSEAMEKISDAEHGRRKAEKDLKDLRDSLASPATAIIGSRGQALRDSCDRLDTLIDSLGGQEAIDAIPPVDNATLDTIFGADHDAKGKP